MVISCQMPELLQHADISHAKYQSVPNNKCTSCSFSDLPPCQQGSAGTPGRGELLLLPAAHSHGAGGAGGTGGAGGAGAGIWVPRPHFAPWGLAKCDPGFWEAAPAPPRALLSVLVLTARINPSGCVIRIGGGPFDPISTVLPRLNVSGLQIDSEFYKHPDGGAGKAERREKLSAARSCWAAHDRDRASAVALLGAPHLQGHPFFWQPGGVCSMPPALSRLRSVLRIGAQQQERPHGSTRTQRCAAPDRAAPPNCHDAQSHITTQNVLSVPAPFFKRETLLGCFCRFFFYSF